MKKKGGTKSGVMHKLHVYDNGALIGYGFVIAYADGVLSEPTLFDIGGQRLPEGWYQLTMTKDEYPVVVPKRIQ